MIACSSLKSVPYSIWFHLPPPIHSFLFKYTSCKINSVWIVFLLCLFTEYLVTSSECIFQSLIGMFVGFCAHIKITSCLVVTWFPPQPPPPSLFFWCDKVWTQDHVHTKQMFYHWASSPNLVVTLLMMQLVENIFKCSEFWYSVHFILFFVYFNGLSFDTVCENHLPTPNLRWFLYFLL